jgi:hypothetical protein
MKKLFVIYSVLITILYSCNPGGSGDLKLTNCYPGGSCNVFISSQLVNGILGGVSGADTICNTDANRPNNGRYKAFLSGNERVACKTSNCSSGPSEHLDWVIYPNTKYIRSDGVQISTSNSLGIFQGPLLNAVSSVGTVIWMGLASDYTTSPYTCTSWTTNASYGEVVASTDTKLPNDFGPQACSTPGRTILCIEQ